MLGGRSCIFEKEVVAKPAEWGPLLPDTEAVFTEGKAWSTYDDTPCVNAGGPEFDRFRECPKYDGLCIGPAYASLCSEARGGCGSCKPAPDGSPPPYVEGLSSRMFDRVR